MPDEMYTWMQSLRKAIAEKIYPNMGISGSEVFISDGAQCDIARLQVQQNLYYFFSGN
jgi:LL-diaminopimelate aminotransferase